MALCACGCGGEAKPNRTYIRFHHPRPKPPVCQNQPITPRFWRFVIKHRGRGCWTWTGCKTSDGYGRFSVASESVLAHRVAWFIQYGRWPNPQALHHCDNPSCVRWSHLFEGTQADNVHDMISKGRSINQRRINGSKEKAIQEVA